MPREQGDDDLGESSQKPKLVTPALAGLTTLLAASPILSVCPGKEQDEDNKGDAHERKCIRIPDDDGIIIPLHGDSDEEINPERYADPSLVITERTDASSVESKPHTTRRRAKEKAPKPPKPKLKSEPPSFKQKLVTPTLAGLATVIAASPIISEPSDTNERPNKDAVRTFIKTSDKDTVIVPLHGDSDEELHPDRYPGSFISTKQLIGGPEIEECSTIHASPSQSSVVEESNYIVETPDDDDEPMSQKRSQVTKATSKLVTPTLAGMTTLLAASPILTVCPENKPPEEEAHEIKFIRIPNEEGVIVPLHGDSDEEINPERYADPSLKGVQRVGEVSSLRKSPSSKLSDKKKSKKSDKSSLTKLVTPALAGLTTLLAASPILSVSPKKSTSEDECEQQEDTQIHERKMIRIPHETGVIIPLHGDSDEELNPERYEDPSLQCVQKVGGMFEEKIEQVSSSVIQRSAEAPTPGVGTKLVTPTLAGMTTLLAGSPVLTVCPGSESGTKKEVHKTKIIMIPNEKAVIIPLHGDSDEELNSDRYDNPALVDVLNVTKPVEEFKDDIEASSSVCEEEVEATKSRDLHSASELVTPALAGMTTLLADSPIVSVSHKEELLVHDEGEIFGTEKSLERKFIRTSNREEVIVPLHGDSDEELHPERYEDLSKVSVHKIDVPSETSCSTRLETGKKAKSTKKTKVVKVSKSDIKPVTPTLAGLTTLLAASPILTVTPKKEKPVAVDFSEPERDSDDGPEKADDSPPEHINSEVVRNDSDDEPLRNTLSTAVEILPQPESRDSAEKLNASPNAPESNDVRTQGHEVPEIPSKDVQPESDHEYEPINPREPPPSPPAQIRKSRADLEEEKRRDETNVQSTSSSVPLPSTAVTSSLAGFSTLLASSPILSSEPSNEPPQDQAEPEVVEVIERKFIRIPNESSVIIPLHGDSDEDLHPDRYKDPSLQGVHRIDGSVVEEQKQPTSILKRPKEDIIQPDYEPIHQLDEMALEEGQTKLSLQDRMKAGAGEIRDKFRNMSVPKISLPDRPRINFPENFKLPERPQCLKERPQFLKGRPQFLKERPQFLKEKPKFLKERPKFLSEKPKFLTEKPKFNFPDRSKFKVPDKLKFERSKKVDKPKIRKPNPSSVRRPLRDAITISSESSHNLFETLKARTYPRFLSKRKRERERAAQLRAQGTSLDTESSPPSPPDSRRLFPEKYRDIKFADEEPGYSEHRVDVQSEEGYEENTAPFHESYVRTGPYMAEQEAESTMKAKVDSSSDIGESDREQISSGGSSMRHRVGVLEEIDSDEFFLRQKGLSREDVDVSRYLSKEIREAFRSPKNALAHMDSTERYEYEYEDEDSPDMRYREEPPEPPERKGKSLRSQSKESDFNTYPTRPTRRKQSDPEFGSRDIFEKMKKPPRKYQSKSDNRQGSIRSLDRTSRRSLVDEAPQPPTRQKSSRSLTRSRPESATDVRGESMRRDVGHDVDMTPARPLRKTQSRGASIDERTSRGADSLPHDYGDYEPEGVDDDIDYEDEVDDDEMEEDMIQDHIVPGNVQVFRAMPITTQVHLRASSVGDDDENIPGYAVVRKPKPPRPPPPPKSRKEQLQSQLHTIKTHGINFFQTFPRRAMKKLNKPRLPIRSLKNYSALGPVRPPRRSRVFREPVYIDGDFPPDDEQMKDDDEMKHEYEETRDLQSGDIVEKMKGRPLPPPPRPPRKTRDEDDSLVSVSDEKVEDTTETVVVEMFTPIEMPTRREEFFSSTSAPASSSHREVTVAEQRNQPIEAAQPVPTMESSQQTSFDAAEISVSIQTDPLSDEFVVDDRLDDAPQRYPISENVSARRSRGPKSLPERLIQDEVLHGQPTTDRQWKHDPRLLFGPEIVRESEDVSREDTPPPLPQRIIPPVTIPPVQVSFPDKLHLVQLDVDTLKVNELQANSITVSNIDGVTMQISEINGTSGNLILNGIELPPDFIKNLIAQIPVPVAPQPVVVVQEKSRESTPQPQLKRILTPAPPIVVQHTAQLVNEGLSPSLHQASTTEQLAKPKTTRTRRKSPTKVVDDSEDELASVMPVREKQERDRLEKSAEKKPVEKVEKKEPVKSKDVPKEDNKAVEATSSSASQIESPPADPLPIEPSAMLLIKKLLTIWCRSLANGTGSLIDGVNSMFPDNDKRRDAQTAAMILIVIIATLILLGLGVDHSIHHHHWDYLNPPR